MTLEHSTDLTESLLKEREGYVRKNLPGLIGRVMEPNRHPFVSPHIWVLWGKPYKDIFNGIGRCIQALKNRDWIGSDCPVCVYEGHRYSMLDFLNLTNDNGIAIAHEAHRLRNLDSETRNCAEANFRIFQYHFEAKYPAKQIVFLSPKRFLCELDDMEYVNITGGRIDMDWTHPTDEVRRCLADPSFKKKESTAIASSPNMIPDLCDPTKRAQFIDECHEEALEDATDMFHGREAGNDRLIPI